MPPLPLNASTQITRAVRMAVFGASLASLPALALMPTQACAQSQTVYEIAPGPLGNALTQFGVCMDRGHSEHFVRRHSEQLTKLFP